MDRGEVPADGVAERAVLPDDEGGHLPAGGEQPVEEFASDGGEVGPDHHDVAFRRAQGVAGLTEAGRGERRLLGDGDLGPARGSGGLGHGDHVVAEAPRRIGDGDGREPLHGRLGGDHADVATGLAGARGGPGGESGQVGVVGQDDDVGRGAGDDLVEDVVLGDPVGAERHDADAGTGASGVTEMRCGRPASMPASMAAPTSATWMWTFHSRPLGVSTPTMTRLSPSAASRSWRRATAASSVSASRYWTSLPGPAGGWCGRCSPVSWWPWSRRARAGRAGSTPVTVVTRASRTRQRPAPPASTTPASRRTASCAGVSSRAARAPSAAARTTSASSVRPASTAATAASAPERATVRNVPSSGSATAVYAVSAAFSMAAAKSGPVAGGCPASWSARPRSNWARMVPELPRAPRTAPRASTVQEDSVEFPARSRAATAAWAVSRRFVPVSPSGTGKTLRSSRLLRDSDRTSTAVRCH